MESGLAQGLLVLEHTCVKVGVFIRCTRLGRGHACVDRELKPRKRPDLSKSKKVKSVPTNSSATAAEASNEPSSAPSSPEHVHDHGHDHHDSSSDVEMKVAKLSSQHGPALISRLSRPPSAGVNGFLGDYVLPGQLQSCISSIRSTSLCLVSSHHS